MNRWRKVFEQHAEARSGLVQDQFGIAINRTATTENTPLLISGPLHDIVLASHGTITPVTKKQLGDLLVGPPPLADKTGAPAEFNLCSSSAGSGT